MPSSATSFRTDFRRGTRGEFASIVPMTLHLRRLSRVEINQSDDRSYDLSLDIGRVLRCDIKTDWHMMRTGNMFFEPISQIRRDDGFLSKNLLWDIFCGSTSSKRAAAKSVLDEVMGRHLNGESTLSRECQGWSIKNLSHTVVYWAIAAPQNCFRKAVIEQYFGDSTLFYKYMLKDLKKTHDEFMFDVGIRQYSLHVFRKSVLFDYASANYQTLDAVIVPNKDYLTLGYLVPSEQFCDARRKAIQSYSWRVE